MDEYLVFCFSDVFADALNVERALVLGSMEDEPFDISQEYPEVHEKLESLGFERVTGFCYVPTNDNYEINVLEKELNVPFDEDFGECVEDIDVEGLRMLLSI